MTATTDTRLADLIEQIAQQNAQALKQLYDTVSGKLYGLALRVVGSTEAAEDVLQHSFMQVWRTASQYQASLSPPMAWLCLIVRSRALDHLRQQAPERAHVSMAVEEGVVETMSSDNPGPQDLAQASQTAQALHGCLTQLDKRQREVLSLAYLRDLSHAELAQQLQLPLGTVKTWIRRGLEQLRGCMAHFN